LEICSSFNLRTLFQVVRIRFALYKYISLISGRIIRFLQALGIHCERVSNKNQIIDLITSIRPVVTNFKLIRIGALGDGGYLIPDDLVGIKYAFSPGVSSKVSFESELASRGIKCFLADYSVSHPAQISQDIEFLKKYVGICDSEIYIKMESWLNQSVGEGDSDCILQMDIEGAEYENLLNVPDDILDRFRILVIEFHFLELIGSYFGFKMISTVFNRLTEKYDVVHIHPNNCSNPVKVSGVKIHPVVEMTFLKKDRATQRTPSTSQRNPLDQDNINTRRSVNLLDNWHS
jgi:hypothetical protein